MEINVFPLIFRLFLSFFLKKQQYSPNILLRQKPLYMSSKISCIHENGHAPRHSWHPSS